MSWQVEQASRYLDSIKVWKDMTSRVEIELQTPVTLAVLTGSMPYPRADG